MHTKTCAKCSEAKPREAFQAQSRNKDSLHSYCRPCRNAAHREYYYRNQAIEQERGRANYAKNRDRYRENDLKRKYGITMEAGNQMLDDQGGCCAICSSKLDDGFNTHVDHCHETGRVRGLLCHNCNRGIGYLQDDPGVLYAAWAYLAA